MWSYIARIILRNRVLLLVILGIITIFMSYKTYFVQLSYEFVRPLPKEDSTLIFYDNFRKMFGEDGNVMVIGFKDTNLFNLKTFNDWSDLSEEIKKIEGIKGVLSITKLFNLSRNDSLKKFDTITIAKVKPKTQKELDSLKNIIYSLPFYEGIFFNKEKNVTLMTITFEKKDLDSKRRLDIVKEIKEKGNKFSSENKISLHYSGMPYIRAEYMRKVSEEMELFIFLAICVTIVFILLFFRSFRVAVYSLVVVGIGIVCSLGTLVLLGYKISILTALIPNLITVIGLPNSIFLTNKYLDELRLHGNKIKALTRTITKVGLSNFLANITTAIGFGVFYFTNSTLLVEFGIVASINIMATYFVALIFIPIILSFLPVPKLKQKKLLSGNLIIKILDIIDFWVHKKRKTVYLVMIVLTLISVWGMSKITLLGFVVDDLPKKDPIYTDLRFFEKNFNGVLPFEISIDTKKEKGIFANNAQTLYKIKALQNVFKNYPEFSKPISIVEAIRFTYQSYKGGDKKFYNLPAVGELQKLTDFTSTLTGNENKFNSFIDSTKRYTRVSYQMADVGSIKMKSLINEIKPRVDSIFNPEQYNVNLTGHSLVFLKGNDYLFRHLFISLIIAIFLILLVGLVLFRSFSIIILSKIPCLIPLVMTAGIMGFLDIHFKPTTILVFSIAFGLASDGTIYILTEYRNQLRNKFVKDYSNAVSLTVKEVGKSMIYTAIILFSGFAIFTASSFGGTAALGILISITLLVSMFSNLILLPSILLSLEKRLNTKEFMKKPILSVLNEEDEEDINIEKTKNNNIINLN